MESAQSERAESRAISQTIELSDADDVDKDASAERLPRLSDLTPTASECPEATKVTEM